MRKEDLQERRYMERKTKNKDHGTGIRVQSNISRQLGNDMFPDNDKLLG